MSTVAEAVARYSTHRRGWDFEFRIGSVSLWWSHTSLEDTCEYFARLINTPVGKQSDFSDMSEFSVETVAIMLTYLDKFTKPISMSECREYIEECLVMSDRYGIIGLKTAVISELENNYDEEYAQLAEEYGITIRPPISHSYMDTPMPNGGINTSRITDPYIRYINDLGHSLIKKVKIEINGDIVDTWEPRLGGGVNFMMPRYGDYFSDMVLHATLPPIDHPGVLLNTRLALSTRCDDIDDDPEENIRSLFV